MKVLAPYNACPKMVPLIKIQMDVLYFKCLFFKKKIIIINKDDKEKSKETKKDFCFLGPIRITPCSYVSSFIMENQGHVVLLKNF